MKPCLGAIVAVVVSVSACGGSKATGPSGPTTTTRFQGTLAGLGGQSGTLDVTINATVASGRWDRFSFIPVIYAQSTSSASGTITLVTGSTVSVSGTYTPATSSLVLSGAGFALSGAVRNGVMAGTYSGPGGSSGGFSSLNASANAVVLYCGTFTYNGGSGIWNLAVSGALASGVAIANVPPVNTLTGQVSGNTISLTTSEGGTGTATISGGVILGTGNNNTVFAGSQNACNSPSNSTGSGSSGTSQTTRSYVGPFSGQHTVTIVTGAVSCFTTWSFVGGMALTLDQHADGTVGGTSQTAWTDTVASQSCHRGDGQYAYTASVTGTTGSIAFAGSSGSGGITESLSFTGALSGGAISGTAVRTESGVVGASVNNGSTAFAVTLR